MAVLIKILSNQSRVIFDNGKFDKWCVYIVEKNAYRFAPKDVLYFGELQYLATYYEEGKIYTDFLKFYHPTSHVIDPQILALISAISLSYLPEHQSIIEKWFTVIYAGMIAEENKENAILKKRVKHLGMYQVLIEQISASQAAVFSTGAKWYDLQRIMDSLGI